MHEVTEQVEEIRHAAVVRFSASPDQIPERIGPAFGAVFAYLDRHGVAPVGPPVGCYLTGSDTFEVRAGCVVGTPIEAEGEVEPFDLPGGDALAVLHVGSYQDLPQAYEAIQARALELGRTLGGLMWEEYLTGPGSPPEQMRTVVHWPLA